MPPDSVTPVTWTPSPVGSLVHQWTEYVLRYQPLCIFPAGRVHDFPGVEVQKIDKILFQTCSQRHWPLGQVIEMPIPARWPLTSAAWAATGQSVQLWTLIEGRSYLSDTYSLPLTVAAAASSTPFRGKRLSVANMLSR